MPSSSSHALVGGLCGAAIAAAHGDLSAVVWARAPAAGKHWWDGAGILYKVVVPMVVSPLLCLIIAFVLMGGLYFVLRNWRPITVTRVFGKLQLFSSAYMGFSHGMNDATKCMGIITLALVAATSKGMFVHVPAWASWLSTAEGSDPLKLSLGDHLM